MREFAFFSTLTLLTLGASYAAPKTKLSLAEARGIALSRESGTVKSGELEHEKGRWLYSFDIVKGGATCEVNIDAGTGKIVEDKQETAADEAKEAAQDAKGK